MKRRTFLFNGVGALAAFAIAPLNRVGATGASFPFVNRLMGNMNKVSALNMLNARGIPFTIQIVDLLSSNPAKQYNIYAEESHRFIIDQVLNVSLVDMTSLSCSANESSHYFGDAGYWVHVRYFQADQYRHLEEWVIENASFIHETAIYKPESSEIFDPHHILASHENFMARMELRINHRPKALSARVRNVIIGEHEICQRNLAVGRDFAIERRQVWEAVNKSESLKSEVISQWSSSLLNRSASFVPSLVRGN